MTNETGLDPTRRDATRPDETGPLSPADGSIVMEARLTQETEKPTTETAMRPVRSVFSLRAGRSKPRSKGHKYE